MVLCLLTVTYRRVSKDVIVYLTKEKELPLIPSHVYFCITFNVWGEYGVFEKPTNNG